MSDLALAELMAHTKQLFEESVAESGYTGDLFKLEVKNGQY